MCIKVYKCIKYNLLNLENESSLFNSESNKFRILLRKHRLLKEHCLIIPVYFTNTTCLFDSLPSKICQIKYYINAPALDLYRRLFL